MGSELTRRLKTPLQTNITSRQHAIATRAAAATTRPFARRRQQLCMMAANGNGASGTVAVCFDFDGTLGAYSHACVLSCRGWTDGWIDVFHSFTVPGRHPTTAS